jgi:transposase-like protein
MPIYRRSRVKFSPETLEEIRRRYVETDETVVSIAASVGIDRSTLTRIVTTSGWGLRKDRPPYELPQVYTLEREVDEAVANLTDDPPAANADAPAANLTADAPAADLTADAPGDDSHSTAGATAGSIADRLEAALEKELRKVESQRAARGNAIQRTIDDERVARTLAMLTETLFKVRRLRHPGNLQATDDDDLPGDADGFRVALAHRIEAFVRSRTDGSLSEPGQPADGEPAAS